jgi:hypothetical protein
MEGVLNIAEQAIDVFAGCTQAPPLHIVEFPNKSSSCDFRCGVGHDSSKC